MGYCKRRGWPLGCQLWVAGLLFMGFWCSPAGEIHNSVLVGFGEVSTFSGALFGVDYSYKYKIRRDENGE